MACMEARMEEGRPPREKCTGLEYQQTMKMERMDTLAMYIEGMCNVF